MSNIGIIAEYNPFHNGHHYHINLSKKITDSQNVIVVMSGNFTQRGLPASCDKFSRCEMALNSGADIVLELPSYYASSSAEYFAYGAVEILDKLNIIDYLSFGSECGDIDKLKEIERFINKNKSQYDQFLKKHLKTGSSFPLAQNKALNDLGCSDYNSSANNILAIEYLKALNKLKSTITPLTIKRYGTNYHQLEKNNNIASASAIRNFYESGEYDIFKDTMPEKSYDIFLNSKAKYDFSYNNLSKIFNYIYSTKSKEEILKIVDMNEELYNRILKAKKDVYLLTDIINTAKCKNYTQTRLQRVITNIILDNKKSDFNFIYKNGQPYIRVLGFRRDKSHLLGTLIKNSSVSVIVNIKSNHKILDDFALNVFENELSKTSIFNLSCNEFVNSPCKENQVIIL